MAVIQALMSLAKKPPSVKKQFTVRSIILLAPHIPNNPENNEDANISSDDLNTLTSSTPAQNTPQPNNFENIVIFDNITLLS